MIVEPVDRSLAGQLTLPYLVGGRLSFVDLLIPSNGFFGQEDLRLLREAGAELAAWRAARIALARDEGGFGEPEIVGQDVFIRDWRSLAACAHDAAALLKRWPTSLDRRSSWLPVGVPGGSEDIPMTAREAESRGYVVQRNGGRTITQSARWLGQSRVLTSLTVSALALSVIQLVRASVPQDELQFLRPLLSPLASVAQLASAAGGHRDPDPSSWPVPFVAFASSCMRTIAELQSSHRGEAVIPLLDTDELYESWLVIQVRDALDPLLGPRVETLSDAFMAWQFDDTLYELWVKPGVNRTGRILGAESFQAIVAELLTPDLVLSATRGNQTELTVLDAKAWAQMLPEDALTQSAKYLYGIRRLNKAAAVPALVGVDLITCARRPTMTLSEISRVQVTSATPTSGVQTLNARIREIVIELETSLMENGR